jgi:hypothetical protein
MSFTRQDGLAFWVYEEVDGKRSDPYHRATMHLWWLQELDKQGTGLLGHARVFGFAERPTTELIAALPREAFQVASKVVLAGPDSHVAAVFAAEAASATLFVHHHQLF